MFEIKDMFSRFCTGDCCKAGFQRLPGETDLRRGCQYLFTVLLCIVLFSASPLLRADHKDGNFEYSFAVVPQYSAAKLVEIWHPILEALEKQTGLSLHLRTRSHISYFEKDFMAGNYDFAYMDPYHSLIALKQQGYMPLIRDGQRQLFGVVVVHKDSPYQTIQELAGQRVVFPAPKAFAASLLVRAELAQKYQLPIQPDYVHTHSSVYLNVALNQAVAGGGAMSTLNTQHNLIRENLRVIYHTAKYPPHPVIAHPRVLPDHAAAVRDAFLKLAATSEGRQLLGKIPIQAPVAASIEDYLPLEALRLEKYMDDM